jgi:shikimate 5-dehydrogenase
LLYEALTQLLLQAPFTIQFQDSVLIVGTGAVARVAVSVLFKTGFRHFLVAAISENEAQDFIIEMSRTLLGVKFTTVPFQQLVHLTSGCSLVVNASPVQDSNFILPELLYFNFLRQEGWVWDFNLEPVRHPFIEEAVELGLRVLRGYEIAASVDGIWVELVFGRSFDCQTYQDRLLKALLK